MTENLSLSIINSLVIRYVTSSLQVLPQENFPVVRDGEKLMPLKYYKISLTAVLLEASTC